jgi:hypothetical protein
MSVQTDYEEKRDTYNALLNYRSDLRDAEKKRDDFTGDEESEEYEAILNEIDSCERNIDECEYELGID